MAVRGGAYLASFFGTRVMDQTGEFTCNMVNVQIPLPSDVLPSDEINDIFNHKMLAPTNRKTKVSAGIFHHNGAWWTRCSAQIWTENADGGHVQLSDFALLGSVLKEVCAEVVQELGLNQNAGWSNEDR
ncbi:hypothetical protein B0H14DRAFT_3441143 [Mycena olivaceomarginata]|nr:hypothetical protein B0H14DRAFT_3441143 [Mycena olivaceomarginata]